MCRTTRDFFGQVYVKPFTFGIIGQRVVKEVNGVLFCMCESVKVIQQCGIRVTDLCVQENCYRRY